MKKITVTCPTCGGHVEEFDCLDTMVEQDAVVLFKVGECDHCGNHYEWYERYTFSKVENLAQIERNEEDYEPDVDECGFDPYEGCYTYDC